MKRTKANNYFFDGHGYEILGLVDAKTDEEKIVALQKHLEMLKGHHNEVYRAVELKLADIKYGSNNKGFKMPGIYIQSRN